jgi:4-amino-4-deoxy-L-arabinose transferase-like glycosyltransferase
VAWSVAALYLVAVTAMILGPHRIGDIFAETDFYGGYAEGARALLHGKVDPSRYGVVGPGYEWALALVGALIPNLFLGAELLSATAMVTGLLLWTHLFTRRAGPRLAALAALFLAVNPTFFRYGYSVTNDALAFALQAGAMTVLLVGAGLLSALGAGALAALAFLTRYNAAVLLPVGIIALLAGGAPRTEPRRSTLAFLAGFALVSAPWIGFSLAHGQHFQLQFHHNIAYDVFARSRGIAWDEYQRVLQPQFKSLADVIARDPGAVLRRELFNVWDHLGLDARIVLGLPVAWCALAGLPFAWTDGLLRRLWPVVLAAALFFLSLVPVFHSARYSIPLLPCYALFAAAPFASARLTPRALRSAGPWLRSALALVPLALTLRSTVIETRRAMDQLPIEVLDCAETLRAQARPGDRIICRKPQIAFHAGVDAVGFPFTRTLAELATVARAKGARWLYFSWPEAEMRPAYWYLLDTTAVVPGLTIRRATAPRPAVLYEIGPAFGNEPAWLANDTLRTWHIMRARIRVDASDRRALFVLGGIEFDHGDYVSAREHLARAVAGSPAPLSAWLMLGEIGLIQEDPTAAEDAYRQALTLAPDDVRARVGLGWASLVARRPAEAAARWRPVVNLTDDPHTLERMVDLFHAVGDPVAESEARAALARARGRR